MQKHIQICTLTLLTAALLALAALSSCSYSEEGVGKEAPVTGTNTRTMGAAGSTFIAPLMNRWGTDYGQAHAVRLNYRPIGSGGGIDETKQGRLDFAASDAPLSDDQLKDMPLAWSFWISAPLLSLECVALLTVRF